MGRLESKYLLRIFKFPFLIVFPVWWRLFYSLFLLRFEKLPIRENLRPSCSFLGRSKTDRWTTWPSKAKAKPVTFRESI